jgi:hypothetical protein
MKFDEVVNVRTYRDFAGSLSFHAPEAVFEDGCLKGGGNRPPEFVEWISSVRQL